MPKINGKDIIAVITKGRLAKFQKKTVTPTTVGQTIKPDDGYDGLSEVVIGSATLTAKKTVTPKTTQQTINPDSGDIGLLGVVVNATPLTSQKSVTPQTYSQTVRPNSGHLGIKSVVVNATPLTSQKTVTPGTSNQNIVPDSGDLGLTSVVVEGDANLISENIKENVSIFGVVGSVKAAGPNKLASIIDKTIVELTADDLYGVINIRRDIFETIPTLKSVTISTTVKTIATAAFRDDYSLTDVIFPSNGQLTSIGNLVFSNSHISSITIPESLTECYSGAFANCLDLSTINWNATECATVQTNSYGYDGLFIHGNDTNMALKIANIGANVQAIPDYIFKNCGLLKTVIIEENSQLVKIGEQAFYNCDDLTSITIPNGVTIIGHSAFYGCRGLTSITIPNSVTSIGDSAFNSCTGLTSITIPNSVTSIGDYTFQGCTGLASVTIPDSVTSIGNYAFPGCRVLASITIPNSVTNIGDYAFYGCRGLTSITIPNSVTSIGDYTFQGCTGLASITLLPTTPPTLGSSAFDSISSNAVITVPKGTVDTYKAASGWSSFASKIVEATE